MSPEVSAKSDMLVPLLIGHADDDEFIPLEQGQRVFKAYHSEDKQFFILHGGHNGKREPGWIEKCARFCFRVLGIQAPDYKPTIFTGFIESDFVPHFGNIKEMMAAADAAKAKKEQNHQNEKEEKSAESQDQQENEEINKDNHEVFQHTDSTEETSAKTEKIEQENLAVNEEPESPSYGSKDIEQYYDEQKVKEEVVD